MKGDFTRSTFRPEKHYTSVRMQQGRVQLDADWNEQTDIAAHRDETAALDVVGQCGGPRQAAGFALAISAAALPANQQQAAGKHEPLESGDAFISAGRYYVDGILCENELPVTLSEQPDGPRLALPATAGVYLVFLDVWQRHLTALDDVELLEVALGGPDTSTRTKTVWQVKWLRVDETDVTCGSAISALDDEIAGSTGAMSARARPAGISEDNCMLQPDAGYQRLENQLYRVEIHDGGSLGTATFKWSRDNGSVVSAWAAQSGNDLTLGSVGRDSALGFAVGDYVELTDDTRELQGAPGALVRVVGIEGQTLTVDPGSTVVDRVQFPLTPKVRRWNMGSGGAVTVDIPATNDGFIELEDGVEVKFESGTYKTGDSWLIPARTATGDVAWPFTEPQPPQGIAHHYCRLGLLTFDGRQYTAVQDCRQLFPPVTDLTSLFYVGGDGQVGAPGQALPQPLQVGVANGQWPVPGAIIRFAITQGSGTLQSGEKTIDVVTDSDGVASCQWRLGVATQGQQVEATLLDPAKQPVHLPVRFNGSFCEDAQDLGIQIEKVQLSDGTTLENDSDVAVDLLARGIDLVCSAHIAVGTVSRTSCFLTLEVPFPITSGDTAFWGTDLIGYQPLVLAAVPRALKSVVSWRPTAPASAWLQNKLFKQLAALNGPARVLARLTVLGNFVWQAEKPDMFLDAEVFGMRVGSALDTRVRLPSGDGRRGGRLDMWFWAVPSITVSISPETVAIKVLERVHVPVTFTVTVEGTENTAVEMSVDGIVGGNNSSGTITLTDETLGTWTYRAPTLAPVVDRRVTVAATSLADRTRVARATVTLLGSFGPIDFPGVSESESEAPRTEASTEEKPPGKPAPAKRAPARKKGRKRSQ